MRQVFVVRWQRRCVLFWLLAAVVLAPVAAHAISQGYKSDEALPSGALVSSASGSATVRLANSDLVGEMIGVVVANDNSLVAVSNDSGEVQIISSGAATALVSNVNGDIKKGDAITASPLDGVGMKATTAGRIIGSAQADFSASTPGAVSKQVDTKVGKREVAIGGIPVLVGISYYTPKSGATIVPVTIQNALNQLAGKEVSWIRILLASILLILGLVIAFVILSSAIRSSLESIGRNPLARSAINAGLLKVLAMTLVIVLVTLASVYLVIAG
jgi:hypothetical protein